MRTANKDKIPFYPASILIRLLFKQEGCIVSHTTLNRLSDAALIP